ncbi:MAG: hypothetical protein GY816_18770 [Cytophagales bacterium]|nr:hypothetical protein [Cytophagales bacterium]
MKRMLILLMLGAVLYLLNYFYGGLIPTHKSFEITLVFFLVQTIVLLRIDQKATDESRIIMNVLKITIRLLSALAFIFYLLLRFEESTDEIVIQFVSLYFVFMIFEIATALSNLRRN